MASDGSFKIGLSVTDNATAAFKKLNAQIASLQKPAKDFNREFDKFTKLTGLSKLADGFKAVTKSAFGMAKSIGSTLLGVIGLGGAASLAGIAALTAKWGEWGQSVQKTADWLGNTPKDVLAMSNMSQLLGADANSLAKTYENIGDMQRNARLGLDPRAMQLFGTFGITTDPKKTKEAMNQIFDIARRIKEEGDPAKLRAFFAAFQIPPDMIEAITKTKQTYQEFEEQSKRAAEQMAPFQSSAERFNVAFNQLSIAIKGTLSEALLPLANEFAKWLSDTDNQKSIIDNLRWAIGGIRDFAKEAVPEIKKLWTEFREGNGWFGKVKFALEAIAAISFASWATRAIASLGTVLGFLEANPVLLAILTSATAANYLATQLGRTDANGEGVMTPNPGGPAAGAAGVQKGWTDQRPAGVAPMPGDKDFRMPATGGGGPVQKLSGTQNERAQTAFDQLTGMGVDPIHAKAMLGNWIPESSLNPRADNGTHYGLAQWDAGRQRDFAEEFHHSMRDQSISNEQLFKEEVKFAVDELKQKQSGFAKRFNAATSLQAATDAYNTDIERSGVNSAHRIGVAGALEVTVKHENPPPGASVTAKTSGSAFKGTAPQVATAMPAGGNY